MRYFLSFLLALTVILGWASPAHACSVAEDYYPIRDTDLVGLNTPNSALAVNYQQWVDESSYDDLDPTPPTILGAALYEVVGTTPSNDVWSKGVVTVAVKHWGTPPTRVDRSAEPVEYDSIIPGSCESSPVGSDGEQYIVLNTDRSGGRVDVSEQSMENLDLAFGPSTQVPVDQNAVDAKLRRYKATSALASTDEKPLAEGDDVIDQSGENTKATSGRVGLVVGSVAIATAVIAAGFFLFRRRTD